MATNLTEAVFCALKPFTFYRVKDIQNEVNASEDQIRKSVNDLSLGGGS